MGNTPSHQVGQWGGDQCPLPPISPLTCTLEPVHGVRGPRPQKASEVSLGRIPRLDLPLGLAFWLASEVEVRSPGAVLLPLWEHQSETALQLSPETPGCGLVSPILLSSPETPRRGQKAPRTNALTNKHNPRVQRAKP